MLFGAVATGNIKAQLALNTAGNIIHVGFISAAMAVLAKMGINNTVLAVLLVVSVKKLTAKHSNSIINMSGKAVKTDKYSPIKADKPEATKALAKQIPPPNSSNTPQGML